MAAKIRQSNLDNTAVTGHTTLSANAETNDKLVIFDTSAGVLKTINASNVGSTAPTITSISPSNATTGDGTGNHTFVITGTGYDANATAKFINNSGAVVNFDTVTRNSATQITAVIAKSSLLNSVEPFDIVVTRGDNNISARTDNAVNVDAQPVYVTSAGTLGTLSGGAAMTAVDVVATDPESAGNVTFEKQSGTFPPGMSTATVNEDGVSKFRFSGTPTNPVANTTFNFVLRAVDAASNTTSRAFAFTVNRVYTQTSFTSSGTFAVPTGVSSLDAVLIVAGGGPGGAGPGGGGGAGGLVFMPGHPVSPGGTIALTVGCGAAGATGPGAGQGQDSVFGASPSPGTTVTLTAKGGGRGGVGPRSPNSSGGAGGSGGGGYGSGGGTQSGGTATQPTQPGNSGAYGFGNAGGQGVNPGGSGGGGGAGAVGGNGGSNAGQGGQGKAYTIADGTTSVYYAGGGGGAGDDSTTSHGSGGQGGGGGGTGPYFAHVGAGSAGQANKGGGGGGSVRGFPETPTSAVGGKGIIVVRY